MNIFCRIFGHTWWPEIEVPSVRWNTTKDGQVLVSSIGDEAVRHYESCKRCGETREVGPRALDADRPSGSPEDAPEAAAESA